MDLTAGHPAASSAIDGSGPWPSTANSDCLPPLKGTASLRQRGPPPCVVLPYSCRLCPARTKEEEEREDDEWAPFVIVYRNRFGA